METSRKSARAPARDAELLPEPDVEVEVPGDVDGIEPVVLAVVPRVEVRGVDEVLALVRVAGAKRDAGLGHDLDEVPDANGRRVEARRDPARRLDVRELPEVAEARELRAGGSSY